MNRHRGTTYTLRSITAVLLFTPAMVAMQASAPPGGDELWRAVALAALGGLATAFVLGRNAVTRQDLVTFELKMTAAMKEQSPWAAVVDHRLDEGDKKFDYLETRVHKIAEDGQVALGLKEFVLQQISMQKEIHEDLAQLKARRDVA